MRNNKFQSPLGKARGLGSTHEGAHHWLHERITAIILAPLVMWIVYSVLHLKGAPYETFIAWMQNPVHALLMMVFIMTSSYHAAMGLQVIIEDYVSCHCLRMIKVIGVKIIFGFAALASIFSILKIAL